MFLPAALIHPQPAPPILTRQAKAHPMRYHVVLPAGWRPGLGWAVVVVIPDAHRDFKENLARFVAARGARPYLLVAPEVLTCGGARGQTSPPYAYTADEWAAAKGAGDFEFDDAGLAAVLAEVRERWGGEAGAFLTGWEAGGHTVWAQALRRPERWRAVAPVSPNYQGRGLAPGSFATAAARRTLPLKVFWCGAPRGEAATAMAFLKDQTARALTEARARGFAPQTDEVVEGADHGPLSSAVLGWFDTLRSSGGR